MKGLDTKLQEANPGSDANEMTGDIVAQRRILPFRLLFALTHLQSIDNNKLLETGYWI